MKFLGVFSLEKVPRRLYSISSYLKRSVRKMGTDILPRFVALGPRGNGFKLKEGRFRLNIRKKFFIMRMVSH